MVRLGSLLALLAAPAAADALPPAPLATVRVASGLDIPVFVTHAPGDPGRLFIVEQAGVIKILDLRSGAVLAKPYLDMSARVSCCDFGRGLYAMAFHPNYAKNGYFYVAYMDNNFDAVVARFRARGRPLKANEARENSHRVILKIQQDLKGHNIDWVGFGPKDGYLYIAKGDGGVGCDPTQRSQNLSDLNGKILRIDVDGGKPYAIPPDNPFVGTGGREEIWAYGLRNPWRPAFDPETGDLYIGDVGQRAREEINFQPASSGGGANYGWDCMEGNACSTLSGCAPSGCACGAGDLVRPVHEYAPGGPGCTQFCCSSVTGGEVYRGTGIPGLAGTYFFADFCTARIWSFRYDGAAMSEYQERTDELDPGDGMSVDAVVSFGRDASGEIYIVDAGGEIFKLVAGPGPETPTLSVPGTGLALALVLIVVGRKRALAAWFRNRGDRGRARLV